MSVVVVAYGHADDLARCLRPLAGAYPLLVVDNSRDPSCALAAQETGARYVAAERNLGFAAAVNMALHLLPSRDHVLLLNPDAVIEAAAVEMLVACLGASGNERVAAVAPTQHGDHGTPEQQVSWPFPSPLRTWGNALGIGRLVPGQRFLVGSVLLLRNSALEDVGEFDERFFLYAEESDWQWRAHLRGWKVQLCEDASAYHAGGGTSTDPALREALFHASAELLLRKWHGPLGWTSARVATILGASARSVWRRGDDRRRELARVRLYVRGPCRVAAALRSP